MIKYALTCSKGHAFEAWFRSSDAYDKQAHRHLVACPECGSNEVEKQVMAPAVLKRSRSNTARAAEMETAAASGPPGVPPLEMLRAFKKHVMENAEDVGPRFADEALRIHHGEIEARAIRGETTSEDAAKLHEEGVEFGVLPILPEDRN